VTTSSAPGPGDGGRARRPNIVLILADDMGYSDLGCYGSEIRTPHLDSLAAGGLRLTQMYNEARCCPTRASLLTGLYPHQTGVGHMVDDLGTPGYRGFLNDRCVTIAEALRLGGYRTYMSGKWHVGGRQGWVWDDPRAGQPEFPRPIDRGFDQYFGTLAGMGSYFDPHTLMRDGRFLGHQGPGFYYTDAIGDNAVRMVADAAPTGDPFFLYVAFTAPHYPLHALEEDIARYRGRYRAGWAALRAERHERQQATGLLPHRWPLSPHDPLAPPWEELSEADRAWEDARMAVYAAQVDRLDQNVGKILAALRAHDLEENTLVMFLSDNGATAEYLAPDIGPQIPSHTRDGRPMRKGNVRGVIPGAADTLMSYDLPWANASNTPFRLYKHWVHEGGIATPLIAHWPGVTRAGEMAHQPCHLIDVMATCLDAAGLKYPTEFGGRTVLPVEGESLLPLFRGASSWRRQREIYWEHEGNRAVREGRWKLVSKFPDGWELYDVDEDRTELVDLSGKQRDKVAELGSLYEHWAARCGVVAWEEMLRRRARNPRPHASPYQAHRA
jgi:arylsulfatase A-like enzyme